MVGKNSMVAIYLPWNIGRNAQGKILDIQSFAQQKHIEEKVSATGAEKIDHSRIFGLLFGIIILLYLLLKFLIHGNTVSVTDQNFINLLL